LISSNPGGFQPEYREARIRDYNNIIRSLFFKDSGPISGYVLISPDGEYYVYLSEVAYDRFPNKLREFIEARK
jgi:hypothetical protein